MLLHVTLTIAITCISDTQICYMDYCYTNMLHGYTNMLHGYTDMIHRYTDIHWYTCIDYIYVFLYFLPVIPLHDCFPLLLLIFSLLIISLLDMSVVDTRCVELSATGISATGATSRIPHLLYIVSRYLVLCY